MTLLEQGAQFATYVAIFGLGVLCGLALLASMGRAAFGLLRPILRLIRLFMRPLRVVLRAIGFKTLASTRPTRAAAALGVHKKPKLADTTIQSILRSNQSTTQEDGKPTIVDLTLEDRMLASRGTLFKWVQIPPEFVPAELSEPVTDQATETYFAAAVAFLNRPVELDVDHNNFYEDEEGGVVSSLFLSTDRRCFYALDRLRRIINANALRFIVHMSILVASGAAFSIAWALPHAFSEPKIGIFALIAAAIIFVGGTFLLQSQYAFGQRTNMNELSELLTRYLSRINNRFREASAKASRVIQGDERDSLVLAKNAQRWLQIMIWFGFRPFFIESFIRNVNFQMRRNLNYYLAGAFVWFLVLLPAICWSMLTVFKFEIVSVSSPIWAAVAGAYFCLVAPLILWQLNRKVVFEQLTRKNWLGFDDLKLSKELSEVIGKYAEEIALWRGRFHQ